MFNCGACGQEREDGDFSVAKIANDKFVKFCKSCSSGSGGTPDVWYGYGSGEHTEENIAYPKGHPLSGQPIPFHDKRSKLAAMRQAGVRECGDRVHGSRPDHTKRRTFFT